MSCAENAYRIMREKKMNQSAVARAAGLNSKTFNSILRGRKLLREEAVIPICQALEVTPNELFGYQGKIGEQECITT